MSDPLIGAASQLRDAAPLVRRALELDARTLVRIKITAAAVASYLRLPFGVLVGRTLPVSGPVTAVDRVVSGRELLAWLDGDAEIAPAQRDAQWRGALPPSSGWHRVESVPGDIVREIVRKGAAALQGAAEREGVPGAQPRAEVAGALLDSVVITAREDDLQAEVSLRICSAVMRMGFLPPGSRAGIDIAGRWLRVAAEYGSAYAERKGAGFSLR